MGVQTNFKISWTPKMTKLEALRQVQLKKACIRRENRKQERSEQTNQYVDGDTTEWSRFAVWRQQGRRKTATGEATHCIRHSNGWNVATTNNYISLETTC